MAEIQPMGENVDRQEQNFSEKEFALIKELVQARMEQKENLEYESFDGYELPPRTQFSMLKKPAVSIKYGKLTFNMACIRLFEGVKYILPIVNTKKKKLAIIPCAEEESASVEWARINKQGNWVNKGITSVDFVENLFKLMNWDRQCRYKVMGRIAASERGLILVFEMEEAIMFAPKKEEYIDQVTGEKKKRQVKYYPDAYKNRIGRSYNDYAQYRQMNLFEDFNGYESETTAENQKLEPVKEANADQKDNEQPEDMKFPDGLVGVSSAEGRIVDEKLYSEENDR